MRTHRLSAFSLTELLIALSVLGIVTAIIIPRYMNVQSQAQDAVATQMSNELNNVYANWKGSGGIVTGIPNASLLLYVLSGQGDPMTSGGAMANGCTIADSGTSSSMRVSLPNGTRIDQTSASNGVLSGDGNFLLTYNSSQDSFSAIPAKTLAWTQIGTMNPFADLTGFTPVGVDLQPGGDHSSHALVLKTPEGYTPYKNIGYPTALYSLIPYTLVYNGITFGTLTKSSVSGSLYGSDGTSSYRADYSQTYLSPFVASSNPSHRLIVAKSPRGYAPYQGIGTTAAGAIWSVTIWKGTRSN